MSAEKEKHGGKEKLRTRRETVGGLLAGLGSLWAATQLPGCAGSTPEPENPASAELSPRELQSLLITNGLSTGIQPDGSRINDIRLAAVGSLMDILATEESLRAEGAEVVRLRRPSGGFALVVVEREEKEIDTSNKFVNEDSVQPGLVEVVGQVEGRRWIGKLEGNGNRDVAIYIPPGFDPNKKTEIIYHFHGTNSHSVIPEPPDVKQKRLAQKSAKDRKINKKYVGADRLNQTMEAAEELNRESDRNVIVVYPTSAGRRGKKDSTAYRRGYDDYWMLTGNNTGDNIHKMHAEVLQTIQSQFGINAQVGSVTAKGHSAGGKALLNIVRSGFALDRIDSLDADYGWMGECYRRAKKLKRSLEMNLFVERGNQNYKKWSRKLRHNRGVRFIPSNTHHGKMIEKFFGWMRRKKRK